MDARSELLPVSSFPNGPATFLRTFITPTITVAANTTTLLLFNAAGGDTVMKVWDRPSAGPITSPSLYSVASFLYNPVPEDLSVRRGTLELTDITPVLNRGGAVRVWNTSQSMVGSPSDAQFLTLVNTIYADPHARVYGAELSATHAFDQFVATFGRYDSFRDYASTTFDVTVDDPSLSNLVVLFEPYSNARTFMVGIGVASYGRYAEGSVLSRLARPIPTVPLTNFTAVGASAAATASLPARVGTAGAGRRNRRGAPPMAQPGLTLGRVIRL